MSDPGCPNCGADFGVKVAEPSPLMVARTEGLDLDRAGTYRCGQCETEYVFEAKLPLFSTTAKCPDCGGFDTKITGRQSSGNRYHFCIPCRSGFKTRDAAKASATTLFNDIEK